MEKWKWMICRSAFCLSALSATSAFQVVLTKSMVKQSGTIGCVSMELNLLYDVACCLSRSILFTSTAHRFLSKQHNTWWWWKAKDHFACLDTAVIIPLRITIKNVINF